jgi:flavin-dependent dehydrogenase
MPAGFPKLFVFAHGAALANSAALPDGEYDVLVVGGGPAGSTVAALLASRGERVVLVEKDRHPRFHIGESLLPMNIPLLEALGVKQEIDRIGMPKYGVEFVSPDHKAAVTLDFAQSWDRRYFYAYQVRRSEFDHILLKNAAAKGATVVEGCRISAVSFPAGGGVSATGQDDSGASLTVSAKFLVDASGRDTFLANQLAIKQRNPRHKSAAVFAHFTGAQRLADKAEGNISIFWFAHGWFWFIPLADGTTSIGAVCSPEFIKARGTDVTSFLTSLIALCPALTERLRGATICGPATATGNYSYVAQHMTGRGTTRNYLLVGDAYAFIDPVFSTGVYLAMKGGFLATDVVSACLHQGQAQADRAMRQFEAAVSGSLGRFSWYIYRMNRPAMRQLFMAPRNFFRMREALLALLSGDVFGASPIRTPLILFKGVYFLKSLFLRDRAAFGGNRPTAD